MALQAVGAAIAAVGSVMKIFGKDTDYPATWSAVRIVRGQAQVMGSSFALDTGDPANGTAMAQSYADYMNAQMDTLGLTEEQRSSITTPGITVGVVAPDRPGAVPDGGFFFGQMDGGSGWMSGIQGGNQGFTSPESAVQALTSYAFNEALKPDPSTIDWRGYVEGNDTVLEEYEDYKDDQREEGRSWMSKSTWAQRYYSTSASKGYWPKIQNTAMDTTTAGKLAYSAANPGMMDLGLDIQVPVKFQDKNFWTKVGGIAQKVGAAMAAAGYATAGTTAGSATSGLTTVGEGGAVLGEAAAPNLYAETAKAGFRNWLSEKVRDGGGDDKELVITDADAELQQILHNIDEIILNSRAYDFIEPEAQTVGASTETVQTSADSAEPTELPGEGGDTGQVDSPEGDTLDNTSGEGETSKSDEVTPEEDDEDDKSLIILDFPSPGQSTPNEGDIVVEDEPTPFEQFEIENANIEGLDSTTDATPQEVEDITNDDSPAQEGEDTETPILAGDIVGGGNDAPTVTGVTTTGEGDGSFDLPDIDIPAPKPKPVFSDFGIPIYAPLALEKFRKAKSLQMPEFLT
jgi:hypothetical protein